jgi:hypothetical protein
MKTFRQFIAETTQKVVHDNGDIDHSTIVGNHHVNVRFAKTPGEQYHISLRVNGKTETDQVLLPHHKASIFDFAKKSVDSFISTHKPKEIYMVGHRTDKRNLFNKFTERMAKKHSGVMTGDNSARFDWVGNDPVVQFLKRNQK